MIMKFFFFFNSTATPGIDTTCPTLSLHVPLPISTTMFMLVYAVQRGLVPVSLEALLKAIELNGTAIDSNIRSLNWGRLYAQDPKAVEDIARPAMPPAELQTFARTVDELLADRSKRLVDYQNQA